MELDAKLWRGDLHAVVSMVQSQALTGLSRTMPRTRAEIVVDSRLLLRTSTLLEGWAVMLARWALEASATGLAQAGPASDFLAVCAKSIDPPPAALLRRARRDGVVRRAHLARAIGQCLRHHSLWPTMAPEGEHNCAEYTRGGWTALHFAAAFGSAHVVEDLLALGASMAPLTRSGLTPLHVACAHGEVAAVAALAAAGARNPTYLTAPDSAGRTAVQLAIESAPTAERCEALLAALGVDAASAFDYCAAAARTRGRERRARRLRRAAAPPPAADGGGWLGDGDGDEDGGGRRCDFAVVDEIDAEELLAEHLAVGRPVLVTGAMRSERIYEQWRRAAFVGRYGGAEFELEEYPYASATAYLHEGLATNRSTISEYLRRMPPAPPPACAADADDATARADVDAAVAASNGELSIFSNLRTWRRTEAGGVELKEEHAALPPASSDRLLADFVRPPFVEKSRGRLSTRTIQFYLGGAGSGSQPHWHNFAWNFMVHGRKEWWLWPPHEAAYTQRHVSQSLRALDAIADADAEGGGTGPMRRALRCEQRAGDVVIVPGLWGHATLNRQPSIGWASETAADRHYDDGLGAWAGDEWWRTRDVDPHAEPPPRPARKARKAKPPPPPRKPPPPKPKPAPRRPPKAKAKKAEAAREWPPKGEGPLKVRL